MFERIFEAPDDTLMEYQAFIIDAGAEIGRLSPLPHEKLDDVLHFLLAAAEQLAVTLRVWIDNGDVLFYVRAD